jgi:signal transduction histidine kinase
MGTTSSSDDAQARCDGGVIPLRCGSVELVGLVTSTLEPFKRQANTMDVTLTIDAATQTVEVIADPEKIAWAVATLVGNALRYVRRGSTRMPGGSIAVRIQRAAAGKGVSIEVADDGTGIPPEKLAHLFERQPGVQHATGLALHLIAEIVQAHGGSVAVDSKTGYPEHGTKVRLALP